MNITSGMQGQPIDDEDEQKKLAIAKYLGLAPDDSSDSGSTAPSAVSAPDTDPNQAPPATPVPAQTQPDNNFGAGNAAAVALAGLGDAFSAAGGRSTNFANDALNTSKSITEQGQEKEQYQRKVGIQQEQDDSNSNTSQFGQQMVAKMLNVDPATLRKLNYTQLLEQFPVLEKFMAAKESEATRLAQIKSSEDLRQATLAQTRALSDRSYNEDLQKHQDALEQKARDQLLSVRGDASLKNIETQRDSAITAYNRIDQVEKSGQQLNPIDYVDILGQIYKARTGSAPNEQVLSQARQATVSGNFNKAYTFLTGKQAPATTKDIMSSLKEMALAMGQQADKLHDAYMKSRLDMPQGLNPESAARIQKLGRGMSFAEGIAQNGTQPDSSPLTAVNKKTGQRIQSKDGGKTWQPIQ